MMSSVSAVVRSPDPHILELERNISVHGGHYATAASCAFGWEPDGPATTMLLLPLLSYGGRFE